MKHKLKYLVAVMGTTLLGHHSTVNANTLVENTFSDNPRHSNNDSFLSKLDLASQSFDRTNLSSVEVALKENYIATNEVNTWKASGDDGSDGDTTTSTGAPPPKKPSTTSTGTPNPPKKPSTKTSGSYQMSGAHISTVESFAFETYETVHQKIN